MPTGARPNVKLHQPQSPEDWRKARGLVEEYAASLHLDLGFQNIEHELDHLSIEYSAPTGAFLIATEHGMALGCAGVRRFAESDGEIKRLYVVPAARGRGIGMQLAQRIVAEANRLGYARLLLDTLPAMQEAQALYAALGFRPTSAYRFNPVPGAAYFELPLR
jgi:GNAT superfamily N-acetyltransferase